MNTRAERHADDVQDVGANTAITNVSNRVHDRRVRRRHHLKTLERVIVHIQRAEDVHDIVVDLALRQVKLVGIDIDLMGLVTHLEHTVVVAVALDADLVVTLVALRKEEGNSAHLVYSIEPSHL